MKILCTFLLFPKKCDKFLNFSFIVQTSKNSNALKLPRMPSYLGKCDLGFHDFFIHKATFCKFSNISCKLDIDEVEQILNWSKNAFTIFSCNLIKLYFPKWQLFCWKGPFLHTFPSFLSSHFFKDRRSSPKAIQLSCTKEEIRFPWKTWRIPRGKVSPGLSSMLEELQGSGVKFPWLGCPKSHLFL
jgi:hypothetical protein